MRAWKVLNSDGTPCHGGVGAWALPNGQPGAWRTIEGRLVACERGLHLCRRGHLIQWLGPAIFEAEYDPSDVLEHQDKIVVRRARLLRRVDTWTARTARLFACDCAEAALPIWSALYPNDNRPREAISVARQFANGTVDWETLDAAGAAAGDAAGDAARAAAWAAAWAGQTDLLFRYLYPHHGEPS